VNAALAAMVFAPALALGSFLNVVVARLPEHRSLVRPRSACPRCGHELAWWENVPLVSYAALRGRCRGCKAAISWRYPAVELATAALVAACFWHFGLTGDALVAAYFCAVLVALSAIDVERRILPNAIVLPSFVLVLSAQLALHPDQALEWVLGALGASLFLFAALLAYPKGMGMGDVKLALLLGAMLGKLVGVGLMLGMLAALGLSVVLFAQHGAAARKMAIPFGPFLAFGSIVALFWGQEILDRYLSLF
jgi:leader peptidase (prepilin peptidase) / N-methyltransferase